MNLLQEQDNIRKLEESTIRAAKRKRKIDDLNLIVLYIKSTKSNNSKTQFFQLIKRMDKTTFVHANLPNSELTPEEEERQIRLIVKNNKNIATALRWAQESYLNGFMNELQSILAKNANNDTVLKINSIKKTDYDWYQKNHHILNEYYQNKTLLVTTYDYFKTVPFFELNDKNKNIFQFNDENWKSLLNIADIKEF